MSEERPSRVGQLVAGKYELEELLGTGGMGEVYRARNKLIGRTVAIKTLRGEHVRNEAIVSRFMREARAANLVRHPNVVDVLDMGRDDEGYPFIVQEFLDGIDLKTYVRRGSTRKLPVSDLLDIMIPVTEAVGIAHTRGVVHRDLKPGNIFLADVGGRRVPKVLDFGVSQITVSEDVRLTQTGEAIGTPAYMSPEQIQNPKEVDAGTDIWSLGVILYELASGVHPFTSGDSAPGGVFVRIATQDPTPIEQVAPKTPEDLARVIRRCLRRKRADRYPTALELARDLRLLKSGEAIEATQKISVPPPPLALHPPIPEGDTVIGIGKSPPAAAPDLDLSVRMDSIDVDRTVPSTPEPVLAAPAAPPRAPMTSEVPELEVPSSSRKAPAPAPAPAPAAPAPGMMALPEVDEDDFMIERGNAVAAQSVRGGGRPVGSISGGGHASSPSFPGSQSLDLANAPRRPAREREEERVLGPDEEEVHVFDASAALGLGVCVLVASIVAGVLYRFVHDPSGWRVMKWMPSAFDGHSPTASGIASLLSVAACLAMGLAGLLGKPRRIGLTVGGFGMLVVSMAMIVVTFGAISAEPEAPPPDAGHLVPYALPVAPLGLGIWIVHLAWDRWRQGGADRGVAIALAALAALGPFVAVELYFGALAS